MSKAQISSITFYDKDNYVTYNDSDMTTDYFNAYSLSLRDAIQWIREDGADIIRTRTCNNSKSIPTLKRVKQICKNAGYEYTDKSHMHHYHMQNVDEYVIEYELKKLKPRTYVVLWSGAPIGESEDFMKSVSMDEKNKDIFVKDLRKNGITRIIVKEFNE